ncbi:MAG TPA: monovalent cation/H+ antiporter subunit D family protein [Gammaproteobacteria bacterium]|nr:monovalent cation/H+ antiporter subunit D family protein [Gammaproteobacteria bacterium]
MEQLPALLIVIPLLAAPLVALLPGGRLPWLLATAVSWTVLAVAALVLARVLAEGAISYTMGGWEPPWGIELRIDALNALIVLIVCGIGAVVTPFAGRSVTQEVGAPREALFYCLFLLIYTGLLGIAVTGDIFNMFVFLEISSLSSYALIALGRDRRALTAAYQYLIMGTIGATFFLIGVGLLYSLTGTLNIADLAARLPAVGATRTAQTAFAFIVAGVGLKLALFPVHLWLPNAYTYAPSAVSAFIAATATKVAVYVLLRVLFTVFGADYSFGAMPLTPILMTLAIVGIVATSLMALSQRDAKRLLAYSSVAQIGYMVVGLSLATTAGLTASITHVFNHALMKGALFLALGAVAYRVGSTRIQALEGLGRAMPWTMSAFTLGGLSLIGVPLTAGFISKWYLVIAALEQGWWWLAAIVLATSLIAVMYVWKIVEAAWFRELPPAHADVREAPLALLVPVWVLTAANLWFGIDTRLSAGIAARAAEMLLGAGP